MKPIIVTGGAGFIGSAFVAKLNSHGIKDIIIVDALEHDDKWKNLRNLTFQDFFHKTKFRQLVHEGKITNVEAVIHMGACSSTTETDADYLIDNNFQYTKELASWCVDKGIYFMYASSAATYGMGEKGYVDDENALAALQPLNMYGYSKQLFDLWAKDRGILNKVLGLKFFNVFGPNEYHKADMRSMVLKSYEQIKTTGKVRLFNSYDPKFKDGEQMRDFVYIKDCTEVMYWLLNNRKVSGILNLGTGQARTWKDLVSSVFAALGLKAQIDIIDMPERLRSQYQYFTQADMTKLNMKGCPVKFTSLEDAAKDYVLNYLEDGSGMPQHLSRS